MSFLSEPVIMETHGGAGKLFEACYSNLGVGVVFEKDPKKSKLLGLQRPTWRVYEADCEMAIRVGVAGDMPVNLLDVDPYGDPWPVIGAFFESERERANQICLVVNDGLRQRAKYGLSWNTPSLHAAVKRHGNDLHGIYLDICREMAEEKAAKAGYSLSRFGGYYCGHGQQMTHYLAVLEKDQ